MTTEVEDGKRADIADSIDVNGELAEKVDNRSRTGRQREEEDEWCQENGQELGEEDSDLHCEEVAELCMHLERPLARCQRRAVPVDVPFESVICPSTRPGGSVSI